MGTGQYSAYFVERHLRHVITLYSAGGCSAEIIFCCRTIPTSYDFHKYVNNAEELFPRQ